MADRPSAQELLTGLIAEGILTVTSLSFGFLIAWVAGLIAGLLKWPPREIAYVVTIIWLVSWLLSAFIVAFGNRRLSTDQAFALIEQLHDWADFGTDKVQNAPVRKVSLQADLTDAWDRFKHWQEEFRTGTDGRISRFDHRRLRKLDTYEPAGLIGLDHDHTRLMNMACEYVRRLRTIAKKIEERVQTKPHLQP